MSSEFCKVVRPTQFNEELSQLYNILQLVNAISSAVSITTNLIVILAIYKCHSLRSPSFVMIFSLSIADFGVGSIVQPLYIALGLAESRNSENGEFCYLLTIYTAAVICLSGLSFFIMTFISIDRFLAICLCMKYKRIVTTKRTVAVSVILGLSAFVWAVVVVSKPKLRYVFSMILMPVCLIVTSFNYLNIMRILRKQQKIFRNFSSSASTAVSGISTQPALENQSRNTASNERYKRVLYTMIYIYCAFVVSYLPYFCYLFAVSNLGLSVSIARARHLTATLIFFRSSVTPSMYFWRITNIRKAIWKLLY